jgi:hypothetical protein
MREHPPACSFRITPVMAALSAVALPFFEMFPLGGFDKVCIEHVLLESLAILTSQMTHGTDDLYVCDGTKAGPHHRSRAKLRKTIMRTAGFDEGYVFRLEDARGGFQCCHVAVPKMCQNMLPKTVFGPTKSARFKGTVETWKHPEEECSGRFGMRHDDMVPELD